MARDGAIASPRRGAECAARFSAAPNVFENQANIKHQGEQSLRMDAETNRFVRSRGPRTREVWRNVRLGREDAHAVRAPALRPETRAHGGFRCAERVEETCAPRSRLVRSPGPRAPPRVARRRLLPVRAHSPPPPPRAARRLSRGARPRRRRCRVAGAADRSARSASVAGRRVAA